MEKKLIPAILIEPGEFITDELEARSWTQKELAEIMKRPQKTISEIINGKARITPATARELAAAFGTSPEFWMNLENSFQLHKAYKEQEESQIRERSLFKAYRVNILEKWGWIKRSPTLSSLKTFLGFDPLEDAIKPAVNFRYSLAQEPQPEPLLAWVARVKALAGLAKVRKEITLDEGIDKLLVLTNDSASLPKVKKLLGKMGIVLLFVPHLPQTYLDGAVLHLGKQPIIALTLRYKTIDCFWFTLMHELAHVYLKHKKDIFDDTRDYASENIDEVAANDLAGEWLIPSDDYKRFVKALKPKSISEALVLDFAEKINRHPGIVVGRLQHDGLLTHRQLNKHHISIDEYFAGYIDKPA
jgi:HTH-type transcriptional regulator / antitoxin HigA